MTQFTRRPPEGALSPILSRLPRGLFREEEGREGKKKRGKRRAEVCSPSGKRSGKLLLFLLFNSRCVREWRKRERMEEGDGWIRIRDFFFFFFLIREITNRGSRRKIDKYIGKFCKYRSSNVVA